MLDAKDILNDGFYESQLPDLFSKVSNLIYEMVVDGKDQCREYSLSDKTNDYIITLIGGGVETESVSSTCASLMDLTRGRSKPVSASRICANLMELFDKANGVTVFSERGVDVSTEFEYKDRLVHESAEEYIRLSDVRFVLNSIVTGDCFDEVFDVVFVDVLKDVERVLALRLVYNSHDFLIRDGWHY